MTQRRLAFIVVTCALLTVSFGAASQIPPELTGPGVRDPALDETSDYAAEATLVGVLARERQHVLTCFGGDTKAWTGALALGQTMTQLLAKYTAIQSAEAAAQEAEADRLSCEQQLKAAEENLRNALVAKSEWDKQASVPLRVAAGQALEAAQNDKLEAEQALVAARALAQSTAAEYSQKLSSEPGATSSAVQGARDAFANALHAAQNAARSPARFEVALRDKTRRAACLALDKAISLAFNGASDGETAKMQEQESTTRVSARLDDTLGKATAVASAVASTSSALEQPGAPERIVYAVMSALGADSKTSGTQLLMTLNLASLTNPNVDRPLESVLLRNLFLRVALPLQQTTNEAAAPATTEATANTDSNASRMSFVLGGSLYDDSDPRSVTYDECYDMARVFVPFALDVAESEARVRERQLYYDTCSKLAANANKFAWRAGLGVITTGAADRRKTEAELLAFALVYSPADWIFFNVVAQRLLEPMKVSVVGAGCSVYANAGGDAPNSKWGRISFDTLVLYQYRQANAAQNVEKADGWEARLSISAAGRVVSGGVARISIGPRVLSSGDVGLLSTIALSYDADRLVATLLTPPTGP